METAQTFALGSTVRIVRCESCPNIVGKVVRIKEETEEGLFALNFGRGRPSKSRPRLFSANDLELTS